MKQQSLTDLPLSPEAERRTRMIKYSVAMGVRMICIVCLIFAQGWWLLVFAIGAIVLPYFAVVIANVKAPDHKPRRRGIGGGVAVPTNTNQLPGRDYGGRPE
jgi:hypothetical protein